MLQKPRAVVPRPRNATTNGDMVTKTDTTSTCSSVPGPLVESYLGALVQSGKEANCSSHTRIGIPFAAEGSGELAPIED
jgi:hypothetical protein